MLHTKKVFTIIAFIDGPGIGDQLECSACAAIVKLHIPDSILVVCTRGRSGVFAELSLLNPHIDHLIVADDGMTIEDLMDAHYAPTDYLPDEVRSLLLHPDLVLVPNMLNYLMPISKGSVLSFPDWLADDARDELISRGADPHRWYVCLHVREDGYRSIRTNSKIQMNVNHPRSVYDLSPYVELIDHIIEVQGGQVIRIGDSSMTSLPSRENFLDLTTEDSEFLLDSFVVSRARYMIATSSGPASLANRLNTPLGLTNNAVGPALAPDVHLVATKIFTLEDGSSVKGRAAALAGCLDSETAVRFDQITETPIEDLLLVADQLLEKTKLRALWSPSAPMNSCQGILERIFSPIDPKFWFLPIKFLGDDP